MASQDWLEKDFYKTLGVSKDASADEIRKTYRKLARKYHPDSNPDDSTAEAKFKEISEAYSVLSDEKDRAEYDSVRAMGAGARFSAGPTGQAGNGQGFEDLFGGLFGGGAGGQRVRYTSNGGAGYDDLFGNIFGGGAGGAGFRAQPQQGRDVRARTSLSFEQAINGSTVSLQTAAGRTVKTKIPAGVGDGATIRLRGKGEPGVGGGPAGDLLVTVHVESHPVFTRDGANLRVTVPVTFAEAALGATIEVPTLSGSPVKVKVPAGTPSGRTLRVKGRGVAVAGKPAGDLLVTTQVVVPQKLSAQMRADIEALATDLNAGDPREELMAKARRAAV